MVEVAPVAASKACPSCGAVNARGAQFCAACGARMMESGGRPMNFAKVLGIFAVIIVVGMLICGGCLYKGYNRAVALDEGVKQAWSEVDNQLQRRFELVPNLVETVKGVAAQ